MRVNVYTCVCACVRTIHTHAFTLKHAHTFKCTPLTFATCPWHCHNPCEGPSVPILAIGTGSASARAPSPTAFAHSQTHSEASKILLHAVCHHSFACYVSEILCMVSLTNPPATPRVLCQCVCVGVRACVRACVRVSECVRECEAV